MLFIYDEGPRELSRYSDCLRAGWMVQDRKLVGGDITRTRSDQRLVPHSLYTQWIPDHCGEIKERVQLYYTHLVPSWQVLR